MIELALIIALAAGLVLLVVVRKIQSRNARMHSHVETVMAVRDGDAAESQYRD